MATCPNCGVSSRREPEAMSVTEVLLAKAPGAFSLAGGTFKVAASSALKLACVCGWSILGYQQDGHFHGYRDTQVFPASPMPETQDD